MPNQTQKQAREQQGVARQAVAYRVVHPVPPPLFGPLRLHARRPAAEQRPCLFHAVDRRAVRVAQRLQRPQALREALRQPLRQQAVRLHLRQVARRRRKHLSDHSGSVNCILGHRSTACSPSYCSRFLLALAGATVGVPNHTHK